MGDRIYAVIDATAVNQDGRTGAITEPSLDAQIAMMRSVTERAGVAPGAVDYVEAHGTGTLVGDPIEAERNRQRLRWRRAREAASHRLRAKPTSGILSRLPVSPD